MSKVEYKYWLKFHVLRASYINKLDASYKTIEYT